MNREITDLDEQLDGSRKTGSFSESHIPQKKAEDIGISPLLFAAVVQASDDYENGLVESWEDVKANMILNGAPTYVDENDNVQIDWEADQEQWEPYYNNVNEMAEAQGFNAGAGHSLAGGASGSAASLLDFIASKESESAGGYNAVYGGAQRHWDSYSNRHLQGRDPSDCTVGEVMDWQRAAIRDGMASTAIGRYQWISGTLSGQVRELGVSRDTMFDESLQDRLGMGLLERRGLSRFLNGEMSLDAFQNSLAKEWAGLATTSGRSHYAGDGLNSAHNDQSHRGILLGMRDGPSGMG